MNIQILVTCDSTWQSRKILIKNQSPPSGMESQLDLIPLSDAFQLSYR